MLRIAIVSPVLALRNGMENLLAPHLEVERFIHAASPDELPPLEQLDILVLAHEEGLLDMDADLLAGLDSPPSLLILSDDKRQANLPTELGFRSWGLLPLEASEEELLAAVSALAEGLIVASPLLVDNQVLASGSLQAEVAETYLEELSPREIEVLGAMAQGLANKQIALQLDITEHTVKFHSSAIYSKLGVTNRTEAVRKGVRLGLIAF